MNQINFILFYLTKLQKRFILGDFKKREEGFILSEDNLFYADSDAELGRYLEMLNNKELEVVRGLKLDEQFLELLVQRGCAYDSLRNECREAEKRLSESMSFAVK